MKTLIISKEMKERQKYFPWLKIFIKELFKKFPQYDNSLKYLSENVEKEIAALSDNDDDKIKIEALFETINSLFLHFWWKIHWAENCQWKKYWKIDAPYSYCCNELTKYAGKLLYFLIYLGIILSEGVSNSIWINRILQAINVFPSTDDVVYSSLFQIPKLKKKQHPVYMNILKHVLCTKVPLHINEPTVYLKSMMLYKRLINFIEDAAAKATVTSIAANIKPPPDIIPYLSSLKIYLKSNENILNQLFKKKYFKKIKNVFLDAEPNNKNDNLSEILENKREKKKIKIDNDNEKEPIQKNVFHTQNAVSNKMTSSKSSVCHETSEVSAHEAGEESGIFDLSFDKENEQKCNEVPHVLIQDNKNSQSNLFDVSDQNLLPNFGSDLFSESNSFQGVHPFSKIDQQKELLPKDVDYFEERNMRLNSLEVKKNPFLLRKDSHRNKITMNPIFSSAYESTPKDSSNGTCQNHSARNLQFLTTGNINESSSNDFVSSSDLSIGNQFRTPKSVRHNKNTQKTKGIPKDKIKKKEKKLAEMNLKQIGFYRNAKIYTDSSDDILCSSDKEFDDVFKAISNTDTSPSLFPTQKSNVSTFKDCKRKLIASVPRLHLPENCKSNHRDDASNLAETSDESNKLPARSVFEQKSQPRMNDTLEKSMNHTYSLRKRRRSSIERRKLYVV